MWLPHRARHRTDSFSKSSGQSLVWAGPLWTKLQRDGVFLGIDDKGKQTCADSYRLVGTYSAK